MFSCKVARDLVDRYVPSSVRECAPEVERRAEVFNVARALIAFAIAAVTARATDRSVTSGLHRIDGRNVNPENPNLHDGGPVFGLLSIDRRFLGSVRRSAHWVVDRRPSYGDS